MMLDISMVNKTEQRQYKQVNTLTRGYSATKSSETISNVTKILKNFPRNLSKMLFERQS